MKNLINYIWQLPLNLLGALYRDTLAYKNKCQIIQYTQDYEVYVKESSGCITLGRYIFVSPRFTSDIIRHEVGHTKQSKYLGPLYLIIIGVPSVIWATIRNCNPRIRKKYKYNNFFTESWANRLSSNYERK